MAAKPSLSLRNAIEQIAPIRVRFLDQPDFPVTAPCLDVFLPRNRIDCIVVNLEPHEPIHAIARRKAGDDLLLVLIYPANEIIGDAEIECAVFSAREQINVERHRSTSGVMDSGLRLRRPRNDGCCYGRAYVSMLPPRDESRSSF